MENVIKVAYTDGGTLDANPSQHGGVWSYRHIGPDNAPVAEDSGIIFPRDVGLDIVSNNVAELWGVIRTLEALPDRWRGELFTDSEVTEARVNRPAQTRWNGVPDAIAQRFGRSHRRLGRVTAVLVSGHPTRADLVRGRKPDGRPVSEHNVAGDVACNTHKKIYWRVHAADPSLGASA